MDEGWNKMHTTHLKTSSITIAFEKSLSMKLTSVESCKPDGARVAIKMLKGE